MHKCIPMRTAGCGAPPHGCVHGTPCGQRHWRSHSRGRAARRRSETLYDGKKVDVWSAAVMLYELAVGLRPFVERRSEIDRPTHNDIREVMKRTRGEHHYISRVIFAPQRVAGLSPELVDLLKRMFVVDPAQRLTMQQVRRGGLVRRVHCTSPCACGLACAIQVPFDACTVCSDCTHGLPDTRR